MKARRALCVSRERSCCSAVEAALGSAGLEVVHCDALPSEPVEELALVVVDRAARVAAGEALRAISVPVVVVGDDLDDDGLIALMLEAPVSHLVENPSDRTLGITSEKLATGDLFGLEKYVAAPIHERIVSNEAGKRRAMDEVCAWAESVGARRPVVHRIASVVDELLMNALHAGERSVVLRWASDAETLAISVGDAFGALSQRDVIAHVRRARDERGRPNPVSEGGAGLGLYLVLANVAALVVNVEPGRQTEVVCLFDLARGKPAASGVRSLHVFAAS
jgi:anti-sigma regulatory factor (Ser/Thr protein kinase)